MTSYQSLSVFLGVVTLVLLWINVHRWLSFTCVGVFTMFFLIMNYTGMLLTVWGYDWQTIFRMSNLVPFLSEEQLGESVLMVNVGFFAVWAGVLSFEGLWGTPRLYDNRCTMPIDSDTPLGMRSNLVFLFGVSFSIAFFLLFRRLAGSFFSVTGGASAAEQLEYRLDATRDRTHYLLTMIAYNVLPYLAMCGLVIFWKTRQTVFLALVPLALFGKFVYLHKEPLVMFLLHTGIVCAILHSTRSKTQLFPWVKVTLLSFLTFILLPFLYIVVLGYLDEKITFATFYELCVGSLERILGRMSNSYFYFAFYFPELFDFHGLSFVKGMSDLTGWSHVAINKEIFYDLQGADTGFGSIASDNLVNLYGGFGFSGLVIGGFFQGVMLSGVDLFFSRIRPTLGWFILYSFMIFVLGCTLNQAHLFGVLLGYGGISFVFLALAINSRDTGPLPSQYLLDRSKPLGAVLTRSTRNTTLDTPVHK